MELYRSFFFQEPENLIRIIVVSILAYIALIFFLRMTGNRTLSKMNAFDFVVTVALGSTLASGIVQKTVPLIDTLVALAMLIGLQYVVTWLATRSQKFENIIKSEPVLLFHKGRFLESSLKKSRVTKDEVLSAVRANGMSQLDQAEAIILESNGEINCVSQPQNKDSDARKSWSNALYFEPSQPNA